MATISTMYIFCTINFVFVHFCCSQLLYSDWMWGWFFHGCTLYARVCVCVYVCECAHAFQNVTSSVWFTFPWPTCLLNSLATQVICLPLANTGDLPSSGQHRCFAFLWPTQVICLLRANTSDLPSPGQHVCLTAWPHRTFTFLWPTCLLNSLATQVVYLPLAAQVIYLPLAAQVIHLPLANMSA